MAVEEPINDGLEPLLDYLQQARGFDFTAYKRSSLRRRILKRMQMVGISNIVDYNDYLELHAEEFEPLFNTILINVTSFFRDAGLWDYLWHETLPILLAAKRPLEPIRAWSAGCSSGEEAYSLAIILAETLGFENFRDSVKIYATDVDNEALNQARQSSYLPKQLHEMPGDLLGKYFTQQNGRYVLHKELRRAVIFGRHDLLQDAPISRVDLLLCRNTLMYFNAEAQAKILNNFAFATRQGGFLVLGKAEMLLNRNEFFVPVDLSRRVFVRAGKGNYRVYESELPVSEQAANPLSARLNELSLERDTSPQLAIDANGMLLVANEMARSLFNLRPVDLHRLLYDLDIAQQPFLLRPLIERAFGERRAVLAKDVEWATPTGMKRYFDVGVIPLVDGPSEVLGAKIVYNDMTQFHLVQEELEHSHIKLESTNAELQSTIEELETTNEELQSTVEELETTNEELQSTNEELETMNEELQSTNEELEATNQQLRERGEEVGALNGFLEGILSSLSNAVIVIDEDLLVTAWNKQAEELWGMRAGEVRGKHLMNLDIGLPVEQLRKPIRACLQGEPGGQPVMLDAVNRRGKTINVTITCVPLNMTPDMRGVIVMIEEMKSHQADRDQVS